MHLAIIMLFIVFFCFSSQHILENRSSSSEDQESEPLILEPFEENKMTLTYEEINDFLSGLMGEFGIIALSVAVSRNRQTFLFSLGNVDSQLQRPVNNKTVFQAGPLGQPVFAQLVLKLFVEGIIDFDRPVYKYLKRPLPGYPEYTGLENDARYKNLTTRRILSHKSGFPYSREMNPDGKLDFKFSLGKRFGYSIEGYRLLQYVLEELTGRSINDLAKEKIFDFLGMRQSSFLWEPRFEGNIILSRRASFDSEAFILREKASVADFFLTTASDYMSFLNSRPWGGWPEVTITSKSIFSPPNTDDGAPKLKRFSWCFGWGFYSQDGQYVNFLGGREREYENYASVFYSRKGPASIVVLSAPSNKMTYTARILEELMGDTDAPLDWLDFEQKFRDRERKFTLKETNKDL